MPFSSVTVLAEPLTVSELVLEVRAIVELVVDPLNEMLQEAAVEQSTVALPPLAPTTSDRPSRAEVILVCSVPAVVL
jgi:hypothetical protein